MSAIKSNYEKYIFDNAKVGIAICNAKDNRLEMINPAFAAIHGYEPYELIGALPSEVFAPECMLRLAEQENTPSCLTDDVSFETTHIKKDASFVHVSVHITAIKDKKGNVKHRIANVVDISERKQIEETLKKREHEYRHLAENLPDAIVRYDKEFRRLYVNPEWERINGLSSDEVIGKTPVELSGVISAQAKEFQEKLRIVAVLGESNEWDFEFKDINGTPKSYAIRAIPEYDTFGNFSGILTTARNITMRKEQEEAKRDEQTRLFFEKQLVGMAITSPEKGWIQTNEKLQTMLGYTHEELSQMTWTELTHPDDFASDVAQFEKLLSGAIEDYMLEKRFIHKNGTILFTNLAVSCVRKDDKSIDYVLVLIEDITMRVCAQEALQSLNAILEKRIQERTIELKKTIDMLYVEMDKSKKQEQAYKEKNDHFNIILDNSVDIIYLIEVTPDGRFIHRDVNEAYLKSSGIQRTGIVDRFVDELENKEFRDILIDKYSSCVKIGKKTDYIGEYNFPSGKYIFHSTLSPLFDETGRINQIVGVARDITKQDTQEKLLKQRKEQLEHSVEIIEGIINSIPDLLFEVDKDGTYLHSWFHDEKLLAKSKDNLIGKNIRDVLSYEAAEIGFAALEEAEQTGHSFGKTYTIDLPDGKKWFELSISKKSSGSFLALSRDITERKLMEDSLEKNRASLAEAQRVSHTGSWELDFETNALSWSDEVFRIFEIDKKKFSTSYEGFLQVIHPDDRDSVSHAFSESLQKQMPYEIEHRLLMSDGRVKYVLERGETKFSDEGKPLSTLGIVHDITERKIMEELIRNKEQEFRTIMEHTPDTVARYNKECIRTYANPAFVTITGKSLEKLLGKKPTHYYSSAQAIAYEEAILRVHNSAKEEELEYTWPDVDGVMITSLIHLIPEKDSSGNVLSVLAIGRNISKLKEFEAEVSKQKDFKESLLRGILKAGLSLSVLENGKYIYTNNYEYVKEYGYDIENFSETKPDILTTVHPDDREKVMQMYKKRLAGEDVPNNYTIKVIRANGEVEDNEISVVLVPNTDPVQTIIVTKNVTEQKNIEKRIEFMAHHDALTGLPNRAFVKDRAEKTLANAKSFETKVAILFIDLDGFKTINDSLGHATGDIMLKQVASRLQGCIRAGDTLSRQGGDEFLLILPDLHNKSEVEMIAEKLLAEFKKPFQINNHILSTSASIGIAMYPEDGESFGQLLQNADAAMYKAKETGKNNHCFFTLQMKNDFIGLFQMQNDLKEAIENQEFVLYYQPQVDLRENKIIGVEALIRWQHPKQGMIPPMSFIPIAESSGLIVQIGEWVIMEACRQAAMWNKEDKELIVAVNISAVQFQRGNLEAVIKNALAVTGLNPKHLELELTESILINDTEDVLETVKVIKELGIQLSIDDFGTGYSSLAYLKRFAVDKLKIDQSFVRDILKDSEGASIVKTIIQMAKSFNLKSIAEGVENQEVLDVICEFGCDEAQGYHFAKPMPVDEFENYYTSKFTSLN